jgi:hypothetical protein
MENLKYFPNIVDHVIHTNSHIIVLEKTKQIRGNWGDFNSSWEYKFLISIILILLELSIFLSAVTKLVEIYLNLCRHHRLTWRLENYITLFCNQGYYKKDIASNLRDITLICENTWN